MQSTAERVRQLRAILLIHSYLYYGLNDSILTDDRWQSFADELARMPHIKIEFYDAEFEDWTGATGCHLPTDQWVREKTEHVCQLHKQYLNTHP